MCLRQFGFVAIVIGCELLVKTPIESASASTFETKTSKSPVSETKRNMSNNDKIQSLLKRAYDERMNGSVEKAEQLLWEAVELNKSDWGSDSKIDASLISQLIGVLDCRNPEKQEEVLENYGRFVWNDQHVDEEIARILFKQRRYAEVRALLSKYKPVQGNEVKTVRKKRVCGTTALKYGTIERMLKVSIENTPDIREEDLNEIDKRRRSRIKRKPPSISR